MNKEIVILNNWEKAKQAIAICKDIDEVKKIRDRAEALRAYAKQAREGLEVQNNIAEIKIRCERKIGEFSKELPKETKWSSSHDGKLSILQEAGIQHYERYESIANLPEELFNKHIEEVKKSNEELTSVGLLRMARKLEISKTETPPLPEGKYNVFLADPPWTYNNTGVEGAVNKEYPTMTIEQLCEMPIKELAAEDAVLFLWTTNPILEECFPVIKSWGFSYKTNFVWFKKNKKTGIGFYVRGVHELLLICIKGQMLPKYTPLSIIEENSREHSRKPEIYDLIEKMYPDCRYLELFARNNQKRKKWNYWGNQANA